jgi:hypothetical protein
MLVRLPVRRVSPAGDGRPVQDDGGGVLPEAPPAGEQERPVRLEGRETPGAEGGQRRTVGRNPDLESRRAGKPRTSNREPGTAKNRQRAIPARREQQATGDGQQPPATDLGPRTSPFAQKKWARRCLLKAASSPFALVEVPHLVRHDLRNSRGGESGVYQWALISTDLRFGVSDLYLLKKPRTTLPREERGWRFRRALIST